MEKALGAATRVHGATVLAQRALDAGIVINRRKTIFLINFGIRYESEEKFSKKLFSWIFFKDQQ
jgi:hypothetical protein